MINTPLLRIKQETSKKPKGQLYEHIYLLVIKFYDLQVGYPRLNKFNFYGDSFWQSISFFSWNNTKPKLFIYLLIYTKQKFGEKLGVT
jgi:hypothetical protein